MDWDEDEYGEEWDEGWDGEPLPRTGPLKWQVIFYAYAVAAVAFLLWLLSEAARHPALHHFLFMPW